MRRLTAPRPFRFRHIFLLSLIAPSALYAAGGEAHISGFLLIVAAMLGGGKLLGALSERFGYPGVLGELIAGVLLGQSVLGVVPASGEPGADMITLLAELGVILLLFEVGLETKLQEMFKVGTAAIAVALVGVALPFVLGYFYWAALPHPALNDGGALGTVAIFVGATLTATSVGITARVLGDLGKMETIEARIILGAAVLDDIVGLVILSVVSGIAAGSAISIGGIAVTFGLAVGFLVAAVLLGNLIVPKVADQVTRLKARGTVVVMSLAFALALSAFAARVGSAMIIGAFAAGLILRSTKIAHAVEKEIQPVASVLSPIFFVAVGSAVNLKLLDPTTPGAGGVLMVAGVLTLLAIVGKLAAGWAAPWVRADRLTIGVGMVPRGEVGLIFADVGRRAGLLGEQTFGIVLIMVMATTFVSPLFLKFLAARTHRTA